MNSMRVLSQGTTSDAVAFRQLVGRMCAHVQEHQPGMLAYECLADPETGQVLWLETYRDEDAFLAHIDELRSSGLLDELMQLYTIDKITSLQSTTDDRVKTVLGQFGAVELTRVDGFTRH